VDPRVRDILEKLFAAPEGPDVALVYADALLELGDPYGEFIARSARGQTREAESLRRRHEKTWLGPLKPFLTQVEYRHGLLHAAAFARKAPEDAAQAALAAAHPMMGALRRLVREKSPKQRINRAAVDAYLSFVTAPAARALREVDASEPEILRALIERQGLRITRLHDVRLNQPSLKLLANPALDRVDWVEVTLQAHLFEGALQKMATHEAFRRAPREACFHFTTTAWVACDELAIANWARLPLTSLEVWEQTLRRGPEGTTVTFRAEAAEEHAEPRYRGDLQGDPFWARLLAQRVPDLRRMVFVGPQPERRALEEARRHLPAVRFELADGNEAVGRVYTARRVTPVHVVATPAHVVATPAPVAPRLVDRVSGFVRGLFASPPPTSDPGPVLALIERGDLRGARRLYQRTYGVSEEVAAAKVAELAGLGRG
jgi:uncharacterized protein (TIGR02996 family)